MTLKHWFNNIFKKQVDISNPRTVSIKKIPVVSSPVFSYTRKTVGSYTSLNADSEFEGSEYNLAEIGRAEDVESFLMLGNLEKSGLMFKAGWDLTSKNRESIQYIQKRFSQIERASRTPFDILLIETGADLIRYSGSFWVKVRNEEASGGLIRKTASGKMLKPVAAYFKVSPETMFVKRKENGQPLKYRQKMPNGQYKDFQPEDVIHFFFNRKGHFFSGTPLSVPSLDDIRGLRRIEQNIEILIHQHLFPLYHYKVGSKEIPPEIYQDGTDEVDLVRNRMQELPSEGGLVTSFNHEIELIGAEGAALKVEGY